MYAMCPYNPYSTRDRVEYTLVAIYLPTRRSLAVSLIPKVLLRAKEGKKRERKREIPTFSGTGRLRGFIPVGPWKVWRGEHGIGRGRSRPTIVAWQLGKRRTQGKLCAVFVLSTRFPPSSSSSSSFFFFVVVVVFFLYVCDWRRPCSIMWVHHPPPAAPTSSLLSAHLTSGAPSLS